jgi:hypothetical protein
MSHAKKIATDNNWKYRVIDSESISDTRHEHDEDYDPINDLNDSPDHNTLIFIRGMYRMGKVVPKPHIAFIMETSKEPNTDTVLQGLIGRMCGYGINDGEEPDIYINNKILSKKTKADKKSTTGLEEEGTTELEKFVNLMNTHSLDHLPTRALNVKNNNNNRKSSSLYHLFPVILTGFRHKECDPSYNKDSLRQLIIQKLHNNTNLRNDNGPNHTTKLIQQLENPDTRINRKFILNKENKPTDTYHRGPEGGVPNIFNEILQKTSNAPTSDYFLTNKIKMLTQLLKKRKLLELFTIRPVYYLISVSNTHLQYLSRFKSR